MAADQELTVWICRLVCVLVVGMQQNQVLDESCQDYATIQEFMEYSGAKS